MHPGFYFLAFILFALLSIGSFFLAISEIISLPLYFIILIVSFIVILSLLVFLLINKNIGLSDMIILFWYLPAFIPMYGMYYNIPLFFITLGAIVISHLNKV
jgi:hypothetical protein